ncbi:MAG: hypothetical protein J4473_02170 [Candidatus Aenigmarchaeota archaeon]|nr:hypothetical protein [Candidatus Aenigmarchaeota archaeon]
MRYYCTESLKVRRKFGERVIVDESGIFPVDRPRFMPCTYCERNDIDYERLLEAAKQIDPFYTSVGRIKRAIDIHTNDDLMGKVPMVCGAAVRHMELDGSFYIP